MVSFLEWDSRFFNLRIGKVNVSSQEEMKELFGQSKELRQKYDLLYIFSKIALEIPKDTCYLVDQKVVYKTDINPISIQIDEHIIEYNTEIVTEDLLNLALESGVYSRFKLDEYFPENAYERLYKCWIEQSVKHKIATEVFCYLVEERPKGVLTLCRKGANGDIGLVATNPLFRGKGIAISLLSHVKDFCFQHKIHYLTVATQKRNRAACHLYEKAGFTIDSCTNIWHWWLK